MPSLPPLPRRAVLALASVTAAGALVASGCGSDDEPSEVAQASFECPSGTSADAELCVSDSNPLGQEIADLVESARQSDDLQGVIVGVKVGEETLVAGGVGDATTGVPVTGDAHYRIGNSSAGFLTTALLVLVDEGKLAVDDPISEWFPDLPRANQITIEMLANSTSGYEHYPANPQFLRRFYADPYQEWQADELIDLGVENGTSFRPGTSWQFADTNLVILGEIMEQIEGKSVGEIIDERILQPLELEQTQTPLTPVIPQPALRGFTPERGVWEDATNWNPTWIQHAGSMISTLGDLMDWAPALGNGDLLSPESHEVQLAPTTAGLGPLTEDLYYTYGIGVGNGWIVNNPQLQGYNEALGYLPDEDATVALAVTVTQDGDIETSPASRLFDQITELVTPENPGTLAS